MVGKLINLLNGMGMYEFFFLCWWSGMCRVIRKVDHRYRAVPYKVWDAKIDKEMDGTVRFNVNTVSDLRYHKNKYNVLLFSLSLAFFVCVYVNVR